MKTFRQWLENITNDIKNHLDAFKDNISDISGVMSLADKLVEENPDSLIGQMLQSSIQNFQGYFDDSFLEKVDKISDDLKKKGIYVSSNGSITVLDNVNYNNKYYEIYGNHITVSEYKNHVKIPPRAVKLSSLDDDMIKAVVVAISYKLGFSFNLKGIEYPITKKGNISKKGFEKYKEINSDVDGRILRSFLSPLMEKLNLINYYLLDLSKINSPSLRNRLIISIINSLSSKLDVRPLISTIYNFQKNKKDLKPLEIIKDAIVQTITKIRDLRENLSDRVYWTNQGQQNFTNSIAPGIRDLESIVSAIDKILNSRKQ
jgi:hypothetical protein